MPTTARPKLTPETRQVIRKSAEAQRSKPAVHVVPELVYVAGPMRGIDQFNFPAFDAAATELRAQGIGVVSPAEHDRETGFDETLNSLDGFDLTAAMRWDAEQVASVDRVVVLAGWERSRGARWEVETARLFGVPVTHVDGSPVSSREIWLAKQLASESEYLAGDETPVIPVAG